MERITYNTSTTWNPAVYSSWRRAIQSNQISNLPFLKGEANFWGFPGTLLLSSLAERDYNVEVKWTYHPPLYWKQWSTYIKEGQVFSVYFCFPYLKSRKPFNLPLHRQSWNPCAMTLQRLLSEKTEIISRLSTASSVSKNTTKV